MKILIDCDCCDEVFGWMYGEYSYEDPEKAKIEIHRVLVERGWYLFANGGYVCPGCAKSLIRNGKLKQWRFI